MAKWVAAEKARAELRHAVVPKRDRKDQGEDSLKQVCSRWFVCHSRLATNGANLYPPGELLFADVVLPFPGILFRFHVFALIESVTLRSIVPPYTCVPAATIS